MVTKVITNTERNHNKGKYISILYQNNNQFKYRSSSAKKQGKRNKSKNNKKGDESKKNNRKDKS